MMRGVVLIVVAVVLGVVLLRATDGPSPFESTTPSSGLAGGVSTTVSTNLGLSTTTTASTLPGIDPSTITVLVANGSGGVAGLAGRLSDQVEAAGYQTATPTDTSTVNASVVYYVPGFEAAAEDLAALFEPAPDVAPLPDPPPVDDLASANLVLVAADDLAGE